MKQFYFLIDAAERGRVESRVTVARRAEADVVDLAVGEMRAAVASGTSSLIALENQLAALGGGREPSRWRNGLGGSSSEFTNASTA